jgi:hypothetical protein
MRATPLILFPRSMFPPYSKITSRMLKLMASTSSWHYGIPPARKITIVSGPSATLIPTSFLYVSRSTLRTPSITYKRRWVTTFLAPDFNLTKWIYLQWISEVMHFCPGLPVLLVGCKKDLRRDQRTIEDLRKTSQRPVTPEEVSLFHGCTPVARC